MMRDVTSEKALAFAAIFLVALAALLAALALAGCSLPDDDGWPDSAEFSTIESGAERFSWHCAGPYAYVVVDHETGCQYLARYGYGMAQLTDADGSPLLVAEAGE